MPVSVLIGRDCPIFHALWQDILGKKMRETQRPRGKSKYRGDTAQRDQDVRYMTKVVFQFRLVQNQGVMQRRLKQLLKRSHHRRAQVNTGSK